MREQLARRIRQAEQRLNGRLPTGQEDEQDRQLSELYRYKHLLARKIDLGTRTELLASGEFLHWEAAPAARFTIDHHTFVLLERENRLELFEIIAGTASPLLSTSIEAPGLEDRLLVAVGAALKRVN
jgi:hypothetical protein